MLNFPEHPEIECCMKTGYPSWKQPIDICCDECGDVIDGEVYEDETYETLCLYCLLKRHLKED